MPHLDAGAKLRAAVLDLAAATPVGELTVTEVCRAAGVTRDSFYRFAADPHELLAAAIAEQLPATRVDEFRSMPLREVRAELYRSVDDLLVFVQRHAQVLRLALQPQLDAPLRAVLAERCSVGLASYVAVHPDILPTIDGEPLSDLEQRVVIAQASNGSIGAIEQWLALGGDDVAQLGRLVVLGTPAWWFAGDADDDNGSS